MKTLRTYITDNSSFLIVIGVCIVIHLIFLQGTFIWLDHNDIEQAKAVIPIHDVWKAFFLPFGDTHFYRPIVVIINSIDVFLWKDTVFGFRLTNLLLHTAVVIVCWFFLDIFWNIDKKCKILSCLFIAVHPVAILIIGSITHRQESLLVLFCLIAVYCHARYRTSNTLMFGLATIAFFLLALFTKETALFILPVTIAVWEFVRGENYKKGIWLWVVEILITCFYFVIRMSVLSSFWNIASEKLPLNEYIATRIFLLGKWFLYLIVPFKPPASDVIPIVTFSYAPLYLILLLCSFLIYIVYRLGLRNEISSAVILLGLFLAPGLGLLPVPRIGSPHYMYLALIPSAAIIALIVQKKERIGQILIVWLIIASVSTFVAGDLFADDQTFFKNEVINDPLFAEGHYYLGNYYIKKQEYAKAEYEYRVGLKDHPEVLAYKDIWSMKLNLASVLLELDKLDEAEDLYLQIMSETPNVKIIFYNRAVIAERKGEYEKAITLLENKDWDTAMPYLLLASVYKKVGRKDDMIRSFEHVLPMLSETEQATYRKHLFD